MNDNDNSHYCRLTMDGSSGKDCGRLNLVISQISN